MSASFNGLIVPLLTPFNEDLSVDYFGLKNLIARLANKGVKNFFIGGPIGEQEFISDSIKRKLIVSASKEIGSRGNLFIGCFDESVDLIISKVKFAEKYSDYCVINLPYSALTSEVGFVDFFDKLFTKTKAQIILYNDPALFKRNIPISGIDRIAGWEKLIGIIDNSKNITYFKAISTYYQSLKLFQANERLMIESLNYNSSGGVLTLANIAPELFLKLKFDFDDFGYNSLIRQEISINSLMDNFSKGKKIQSTKKVLSMMGIIQENYSPNLNELSTQEINLLSSLVKTVFA